MPKPQPCNLKTGAPSATCARCGYSVGPGASAFARCWSYDADQTEGDRRRDLRSWKEFGRPKQVEAAS